MRIAGIQMGAGPEFLKRTSPLRGNGRSRRRKGPPKVIGFSRGSASRRGSRGRGPVPVLLAHEVSSEVISAFVKTSIKNQIVIVLPFFEKDADRYFNSAVVIDCGRIAGLYRKVHLPDLPLYKEQFYFFSRRHRVPRLRDLPGQDRRPDLLDNLFLKDPDPGLEGGPIWYLRLPRHRSIPCPVGTGGNGQCLCEQPLRLPGQPRGSGGRAFLLWQELLRRPLGRDGLELAGSKDAIVIADIDVKDRVCGCRDLGFSPPPQAFGYGDIVK